MPKVRRITETDSRKNILSDSFELRAEVKVSSRARVQMMSRKGTKLMESIGLLSSSSSSHGGFHMAENLGWQRSSTKRGPFRRRNERCSSITSM